MGPGPFTLDPRMILFVANIYWSFSNKICFNTSRHLINKYTVDGSLFKPIFNSSGK